MRITDKKQLWSIHGLSYVKNIMQANDGGAEANILIELASRKQMALKQASR